MAETSASVRTGGKSAAAFRTISEVAEELDLPQHVLRFWETRFSHVKPVKRAGGRRYYRPEDVDLLRRIRDLLYKDGYTIKGVQKLLRQCGPKGLIEAADNVPVPPENGAPESNGADDEKRAALKAILVDLEGMRRLLRGID